MRARDIMTPDPARVTPGDPIGTAAELMRTLDVGIIPVVEDHTNMRLVGVITDRDIVVRCVAHHHDLGCSIRDHMTARSVRAVYPDESLDDVLATMERVRVRRVPVVDDDGRLIGIIAQADLATKLGTRRRLDVERMLECVSAPAYALR
jgi:CBS domain-containing protein